MPAPTSQTLIKQPSMLRPRPRTSLTARPATCHVPYVEELRQRFQSQLCLLQVDAVSGSSNEERKPYEVVDGVALIHVAGVLCNEPSWWHETSYPEIKYEVSTAVQDPDVDSILLNINSPGGETTGAFELADFIAAAGKQKKMWAVANSMAYSAAYLIASQTSKIYVMPKTGGVGSVGVYSLHADYSKALEEMGVAITIISAGEGKTDATPYKPLSKDAKARLTGEVDRLYSEFVGAVARGRKVGEAHVKGLGAHCYHGAKAALSNGLADAPGSVEDAWVALVTEGQAQDSITINVPMGTGKTGYLISNLTLVNQPLSNGEVATASAADHDNNSESNSENLEVPMSTQATQGTADAAQTNSPVVKTFTQAELDAAIAAALATAQAKPAVAPAAAAVTEKIATTANDPKEIIALCRMAQRPLMATSFIESNASIESVRAELSRLAVEEDTGAEINSGIDPSRQTTSVRKNQQSGAGSGTGSGSDAPGITKVSLIDACKRLAARDKQRAA
jgi:capsid assembly protease